MPCITSYQLADNPTAKKGVDGALKAYKCVISIQWEFHKWLQVNFPRSVSIFEVNCNLFLFRRSKSKKTRRRNTETIV